jgi:hypothetical protein
MNLDEFHTLVADAAKRGSTLDGVIPGCVRRAAQWIEQNYTLAYMKRFVEFTISASSSNPRVLPMPSRPKQIYFLRIVEGAPNSQDISKEYKNLKMAAPSTLSELGKGEPEYYWLDALDYIWLNSIVEEDHTAEMYYAQYTSWPTDTTQEPWLVNNAEELLLAQTMLHLAPFMRDQMTAELWRGQRDLSLKALIDADYEFEYQNRSLKMQYVPNV